MTKAVTLFHRLFLSLWVFFLDCSNAVLFLDLVSSRWVGLYQPELRMFRCCFLRQLNGVYYWSAECCLTVCRFWNDSKAKPCHTTFWHQFTCCAATCSCWILSNTSRVKETDAWCNLDIAWSHNYYGHGGLVWSLETLVGRHERSWSWIKVGCECLQDCKVSPSPPWKLSLFFPSIEFFNCFLFRLPLSCSFHPFSSFCLFILLNFFSVAHPYFFHFLSLLSTFPSSLFLVTALLVSWLEAAVSFNYYWSTCLSCDGSF